ncbi:heat shock protein, Hsp40, DnaJ [Cordyceps militaris CM01]|uniref:Tetratricopeptide repeat and J domain-containing co-chaperone DNJ1 n=1 Tax=Cordyceps militaris (strain CM01) TaxID=983644 RepID=G3J3T5_CORMM|nr:heat shock protein, Hsp40, DnaJ [Cordyceps militaris CM01]EGX96560.1 heat shock protein, Hsp40, DnaJ [Cordyceps militaris CM01]
MRFPLSRLALTAGVLSTANALSVQDIPADLPVSSLLSNAQTHMARGEASEAILYYDVAIARDPANYLTIFKRATAFLSIGRANQATDDFYKVLVLKPGFQGAHVQLAKIKSKVADWEGAKADYVVAEKAGDSPELVELAAAESASAAAVEASKNQNWDDCVNYAGTAIFVASRSVALRELRSSCRFARGEIEEGMGDLQHVLHLRSGDTSPHVLISATSFYALGDMDNGLSQIRKCLHSDPDSKVCKKLHKQQKTFQKGLNRATGQLSRGQTTTAGRTLVGTEEETGLLTLLKEQMQELRQAGSIPEKAPSQLYGKLIEMTCNAYLEGNHKNVQKYCEEALELNSQSFWGMLYRAKVLLKKGEFEAAIKTLESANEIHPDKNDKINPVLEKAQIALKRSQTKDYYKILGVDNDSDERQIKSAFRKASKQFHPDKAHKQGISNEDAQKKMSAINEAYEVLSDPELRARFDRGDDPNFQGGGNPFHGSPFGSGGGHPFMYQQGGGGGQQFKFNFPGGGGPFGF